MNIQSIIYIGLETIGTHIYNLSSYLFTELSAFSAWCINTPIVFNIILSLGLVAILFLAIYTRGKFMPDTEKPLASSDPNAQRQIDLLIRKNKKLSKSNADLSIENQVQQEKLEAAERLSQAYLNAHNLIKSFVLQDPEHFNLKYIPIYPTVTTELVKNYYGKLIFTDGDYQAAEEDIRDEDPNKDRFELAYTGSAEDLVAPETSIFVPIDMQSLNQFRDTVNRYYQACLPYEVTLMTFNGEAITELSKLDELALAGNDKVNKCIHFRKTAFSEPFRTTSSLVKDSLHNLLLNPSVNLASLNGPYNEMMEYIRAFNTLAKSIVKEAGHGSNISELFDSPKEIELPKPLGDKTKGTIRHIADIIADYLPLVFLECMPGSEQYEDRMLSWKLNFDYKLDATCPIGAYVKEAVSVSDDRRDTVNTHPLFDLLKKPEFAENPSLSSSIVRHHSLSRDDSGSLSPDFLKAMENGAAGVPLEDNILHKGKGVEIETVETRGRVYT